MIYRFGLFLTLPSFLVQGCASLELKETIVTAKNQATKIKPSFPGIDSETCNEPCSPHIIAPLYQHWNEDTKSLEDPPFSPILYWKDKARDPISYVETIDDAYDSSWTCKDDDFLGNEDDCRNLAWYMTHCKLSKDHPMMFFDMYIGGADQAFNLSWLRSSCKDYMGPNATVLEENLPFLQGKVNGTVAIVNGVTAILFPDPTSDSCWNPVCFLEDNESYQACLQDAQLGLMEVSLDTFVEIKDVWCE